MDNFYVTPDGTIAKLPQRSFLDRLTSGLYDASVEYRKPGGGQEARLGRNQPLTSALNRFGEQKRGFTQEDSILNKTQGFTAGQNEINRNEAWAREDFIQGQAADRARAEREARAKEFQATQGLNEAKRFDDIYNANRTFITEQEKLPLQMRLTQSQIDQNAANTSALQGRGRMYDAQTEATGQKISAEELALLGAINPKLAAAISANPGLTNSTMNALGTILRSREGTSGQIDPALLQQLLGGGMTTQAQGTQLRGTNSPVYIDLNAP